MRDFFENKNDLALQAISCRIYADLLKAKLTAFESLHKVLTTHVEAGEKLDALLSQRAGTVADDQASRTKESNTLRSLTIGLLGRFRQALADEVTMNPALPRDPESKVFAYFDQLEANRAARGGKPDEAVAEETPGALS